jgi:hypothetical protein
VDVRTWWLALAVACTAQTSTPEPDVVEADRPWDPRLPDAATITLPRGVARRAVFHLHSPWSHDACDGEGFVDGTLDTACRDDLRAALCTTRYDLAFLTDHPDHADAQPFDELFHPQPGDAWVGEPGDREASEIRGDDGHVLRWRAGFEDELMPVGLRKHVDDDPGVRHDLLNRDDPDALRAMRDADAFVLVAHTEGRDLAELQAQQDAGLHGVEVFNLHAMFGPDIRQEHLGLDPLGWIADLGPFLEERSELEPDLLFLAVHGAQPPSLQRWDALLQRGPMFGVGGTDAHQNVLPSLLTDGDRVDSYRRMLRWFSTILIADGTTPEDDRAAIARRSAYVAFEALGTPVGVDLHLEAGGEVYEMGAEAPAGTLVVGCPALHPASPRVGADPEITVRVLRDGELWQTGCGRWEVGRGVYRVEVDVVPRHLAAFLGEAADGFVRTYPWVYTNAIRVEM